MKQVCGYCLKEFEDKFCDCNKNTKRTFFSEDNDFKLLKVDFPMCECGSTSWVFVGHKAMGKRQVVNSKCRMCNKILGSETYFVRDTNPRGFEYTDILKEEN
ncbi:MAG: hypothetical protein ACRCX2_04345 [Paraclostridium sp.]